MPLNNTQFQDIMRVYDQKQLDRQRLIEERKEALYQSVPRLAEIDRQIVHLNIQKAKNKALGKAGNDYAGELETLMLEKQQLRPQKKLLMLERKLLMLERK